MNPSVENLAHVNEHGSTEVKTREEIVGLRPLWNEKFSISSLRDWVQHSGGYETSFLPGVIHKGEDG